MFCFVSVFRTFSFCKMYGIHIVPLELDGAKLPLYKTVIIAEVFKGSCQVKKNQKSEKNSDWPDPTHAPPYPFFLETHTKIKNTQKTHNFQKKEKNPSICF